MVTIYDIAEALGINASTVSRTFNNPEMVSERTRKKVFAKAEELDYKPNLLASQLRTQNARTKIIGVISLEPEWLWFTEQVLNGIEQAARNLGYSIVILSSGLHYKTAVEFCEQMRFAGIIVMSTEIGRDVETVNSNIPIVFINRNNVKQNVVLLDDKYEMKLAFEYLVQNGHSKIGCISGPSYSLHSKIRYNVFKEMMSKYNYSINKDWCQSVKEWRRDEAYKSAKKILKSEVLPTALMVGDDELCLGVYEALRDNKLEPGKDISVIGYDNQPIASAMYPRLTTIKIPLFEAGIEALNMMNCIIEEKNYEKKVIVRGKLIEGGSIADLTAKR